MFVTNNHLLTMIAHYDAPCKNAHLHHGLKKKKNQIDNEIPQDEKSVSNE